MNFDSDIYTLIENRRVDEIKSEAYLFKHKKSGARVLILSNDDENKVFSIGFRTPPGDSTGVPHILEHSVLCGSDKYPVKDPFIELAKGSLNTFLNAMTYPDKTVYPIASCNDTDFKNLTDVYLDAVFHPLIASRKEVFLQEGWHYELESIDDELKYNGVVYNEMKGAFSAPEELLGSICMNSVFPDTSYGTESGGDPEFIPDLTYEEFVDFHKKLYHPANSYIYFYGNCDMEERLQYLDREYLSKYDYIEVDSQIETQEAFGEMKRVESRYSVTEEEGTEERTYFAYNMVIGNCLDKELCMAFDILDYALLSVPGAPVKQALMDAGMGDEIYGNFESGIKQPVYTIVSKNVDEGREKEFLDIIKNTLTEVVKNGVNKQTIEAAINSNEFKYREADYGRFPKGLMYGLNTLETWIHDETRPFDRLTYNDAFAFLREQLKTDYFERLIEKYMLNNEHSSIVVMKPVINLTEANDIKTAEKLAEYKKSLSKEELQKIVDETANLKIYQTEPSLPEELSKIPLLNRADISKEIVPLYNDEKEVKGVKVLHHNIFTNGIGYTSLCFNVDSVKDEDLSFIGLLETFHGFVNTDKYTYEELSNLIDIHTGGIFCDFTIYNDDKKKNCFYPYFMIKLKALTSKFEIAYDLIENMTFHAKYDDYKRLKEVLAEHRSRLFSKMTSAGHSTAIGICASEESISGYMSNVTSGYRYYEFVNELYNNFEEKKEYIATKLYELTKLIFNKNNMIVSFVGDDGEYANNEPLLSGFIDKLPTEKLEKVTRNIVLKKEKIGVKTASMVNYVARVGNYSSQGLSYNPQLTVLKTILAYDYLWNNVRVLGGAYGCMTSFANNGLSYMVSYRDPNLRETNKVFEGVVDYIGNFEASEREMTKYVIGTFSELDIPMSASVKGARSFTAYMKNVTEEELREHRKKILETTSEEIRKLKGHLEAILQEEYFCVVGSAEKISSEQDMFDRIINLA